MKQIHTCGALLAMTSILGSPATFAHDGMHGPGGKYDKNEDAVLSLAEYTVYLQDSKQDVSKAARRFALLDTNKDGKLSSVEFVRGFVADKAK